MMFALGMLVGALLASGAFFVLVMLPFAAVLSGFNPKG